MNNKLLKVLLVGVVAGIAIYTIVANLTFTPKIQGTLTALDCPSLFPEWTNKYKKEDNQLFFSTAEKELDGLYIQVQNTKGEIISRVQEPSWSIGGTLGSFAFDKNKNIYLLPTPIIYIGLNPKQERQSIFKVDSQTGVMTKWLDIPIPESIKPIEDKAYIDNVYGNIGITSDCKTNKLYVSSIAGSDKATMRGKVYEVDIDARSTTPIMNDIDCYGLLKVEDSSRNQFLLFGNTRETSIGLYDFGSKKTKNQEVVISNANVLASDHRVKKIRLKNDIFEIGLYPFDYTLATSSDNLNTKINYQFKDSKWGVVTVAPGQK
jgi:hypothetical protein